MSVSLARVRAADEQLRIALSAVEQARREIAEALAEAVTTPAAPPPAAIPAPSSTAGVQDLKAFFTTVRGSLWPKLTQEQVDGCKAILAACAGHMPLSWTAYALATAYHETAYRMEPIRERGSGDKNKNGIDDWFEQYDTGAKAATLGNTPAADGDGALFCGRGYVQLTGRANYVKATVELRKRGILAANDNLETNPDLAMRPDVAAAIMVFGMIEGWFTGATLRKYLTNTPIASNYTAARRIINGMDQAALIAGYAVKFEQALRKAGWS